MYIYIEEYIANQSVRNVFGNVIKYTWLESVNYLNDLWLLKH